MVTLAKIINVPPHYVRLYYIYSKHQIFLKLRFSEIERVHVNPLFNQPKEEKKQSKTATPLVFQVR